MLLAIQLKWIVEVNQSHIILGTLYERLTYHRQRNNSEYITSYWSFQNVFALDITHFYSSNSKSISGYEIYVSK